MAEHKHTITGCTTCVEDATPAPDAAMKMLALQAVNPGPFNTTSPTEGLSLPANSKSGKDIGIG